MMVAAAFICAEATTATPPPLPRNMVLPDGVIAPGAGQSRRERGFSLMFERFAGKILG